MYGAIDLLVIGKYASSADVPSVSTGSQIMTTFAQTEFSSNQSTTLFNSSFRIKSSHILVLLPLPSRKGCSSAFMPNATLFF